MSVGSRTKRVGYAGCGLLLAVGLSACASRPSADALTDSILRASADEAIELSDDQASCIANALIDSDLEDVTVNGLVEDFDQPEVAASDAEEVEAVVATAAVTCAGS